MNILLSKDTGRLAQFVRSQAGRLDLALGRLSATPVATNVALADLKALRKAAQELDRALRADRRVWQTKRRAA